MMYVIYLLTFYSVVSSELHVDMIPLHKAAFSREGLGIYNVLIVPKGEGLHRYGLKCKSLLYSKLCNQEH